MTLPTKQPDVIDLTKAIRDVHYQLQLDYQALMLKASTTIRLPSSNVESDISTSRKRRPQRKIE